MPGKVLERARGGEREAFAELVGPHRAELRSHCYRMLGSLQDAEDAVQETLLSAWLAIGEFEERSSVRTWLYRIATNRCLNVLRSPGRRAAAGIPLPVPPPEPTRLGELPWLQPYPDALLGSVPDQAPGPEARYESREAISLAFIIAVQLLPPGQRAVLLLRDVLGYRASEAAGILGITEDAANGALKRARAAMAASRASGASAAAPPRPGSPEERALLGRFVAAFTADDVGELIALMTDDAWVRMPPLPFEYQGPRAAGRFFTAITGHRRQITRLVPVRANGQPGWVEYLPGPSAGGLRCAGILVIGLAGDRVREITHFEADLEPRFTPASPCHGNPAPDRVSS